MLTFQALAGIYALFMLARHLRPALRGRLASILACVVSLVVVAMAVRAFALAGWPG